MSKNRTNCTTKDTPVADTVESLLTTRKYSEFSVDIVDKSIMDLVVERAMDCESGRSNVLAFSPTNKDICSYYQDLEKQFILLKTFISGTNMTYKHELTPLKYPLFVNIYLELVEKCQDTKAMLFYNQNYLDYAIDHKDELQHIRGITVPEKVDTSDIAARFRKNKFVVKLSQKVFNYLLQFLSNEKRSLLLNFVDRNVHIDVNSTKVLLKDSSDIKVENSSQLISNFMALSKALRDEPPCLPSVILHKVSNPHQEFATAAVSKDGELMCGGYEDSSVRLWSLTSKKLAVNKETFSELSQVKLRTETCSIPETTSNMSTDSLVLRGHSGPVYSVCFSQDNSFVLSASEDLSVRLWSLNSYTNRVSYIGHNYPVFHVELSSLGVYFASTSMDQTARLWNLEYNYPLRIFAGHTASVHTGKFHPNSSYLATASSDQTCRLWDVHSGSFVRLFSGHKGACYSLVFTADGKHLIGAGEDRNIHIWDITSGKLLKKLQTHTHTVHSLSINSCNLLISAGGDAQIIAWDIEHILKTGENTLHKPMQVFNTECVNILSTNYRNDNLIYAVGY